MTQGSPFSRSVPIRVVYASLALWVSCGGCSLDPLANKPKQEASLAVETKPIVTGDANEIVTEVDARIKQVQNELWPWVVLMLGLAGLGLVGFPLVLFGLAWLVRRWIVSQSYVGQFEKIAALKAQACRNGAKT